MATQSQVAEVLTQQIVREKLVYIAETGEFVWSENCGRGVTPGDFAGCRIASKKTAYVRIKICGRSYMAHRLVFLYTDGILPDDQVDHINGDGTDNRKSNLRIVTSTGNNQNSAMRWNNKTGITGVEWNKRQKRWIACIKVGGKRMQLGSFVSKDEAARVRRDAEGKFGFHPNHGKTQRERMAAEECEVA